MSSFGSALVAAILIGQVLAAGGGTATADRASEEGRHIFDEVSVRNAGYGDQQASVTMELKRKSGVATTRLMEIATLEVANDGTRTVLLFNSPLDVRGTKVLTYSHSTRDDEQWIYLPAFNRAKQISDANKTAAFMGSEFTYEDINSLNVQLLKFSYRYVRTEDLGGTSCFVVERIPRYGGSGYKKQIVWVDAANYTVLKVEYYDTKDVLLKTLSLGNFRKYLSSLWRAQEMVMVNHQNGDTTRLTWTNYRFKSGLAANDFSMSALKR
jgi:outer membrane lipoprotein-sorting protein